MVWTLRPDMGAMVEAMVRTVYERSILPAAEREVARLKIAELNACTACATFRAPSVQRAGVDEELYCHLDDYATYEGYTERQRLAIEYAARFATEHHAIDDAFFARLRAAFSDAEILDLTMCVAAYLGLGRALAVLGIEEHTTLEV
jgi:AhpD family alkylhydroperoxidase